MNRDDELFKRFAPIEGHPNYGVNANGEVINFVTGKLLIPNESDRGYLKIKLDGEKYYIHRLVADAFVPNPYDKRNVIHKNRDKSDNFFTNLGWATNSEVQTQDKIGAK